MLLFIQRKRPSSSSVPRFLCRAQFQPIATPTLEQSFGLTQIHGDTGCWVDAVCPTGQQGRLVRFQRLVRLISVHQQDIFIRGCSEGKIRFDDLLQLGCLILLSLQLQFLMVIFTGHILTILTKTTRYSRMHF